jgi:hypothetical protein
VGKAILGDRTQKPPKVLTENDWNNESVKELEQKGKDSSAEGSFSLLLLYFKNNVAYNNNPPAVYRGSKTVRRLCPSSTQLLYSIVFAL